MSPPEAKVAKTPGFPVGTWLPGVSIRSIHGSSLWVNRPFIERNLQCSGTSLGGVQ
jgi:hypothetical protein